jgi:hypothetical protein
VGIESSPINWRTRKQRLRGCEDMREQHFNNPGDIYIVKIGIRYFQRTEEEGKTKLILLDNTHQQEMRRREFASRIEKR